MHIHLNFILFIHLFSGSYHRMSNNYVSIWVLIISLFPVKQARPIKLLYFFQKPFHCDCKRGGVIIFIQKKIEKNSLMGVKKNKKFPISI